MAASNSNGRGRTRNFATIVYPESAPSNWMEILGEQAIPAFVSPLHDKDVNPTGEVKKEHYHVMIMFDGVKSVEQAKAVFELINGVGCDIIQSVRGYARYLCHLDNPEKYQYPKEDVKVFGGADYFTTISLVTDKYAAIGEMIDYCEAYNIVSYSELLLYCRSERSDWFRVLCDNGTVVIKEYLKSRAWTVREQLREDANDKFFDKVQKMKDEGMLD